jgi:hypothetical protein
LRNVILEIRSNCDPVDKLSNIELLEEWKKRFVETNGTQTFEVVDRAVAPVLSRQ